ncbi:MAG: preprotein translocase subunit YajC [Jatrophihabitans sp.]
MNFVPLIVIGVLLAGAFIFMQRQRQKAAGQEADLRERLQVGSKVMTTSGLYGVVAEIDESDDTVQLTIATGVTVKWAFAALRDVESLPDRYRRPVAPPPGDDTV